MATKKKDQKYDASSIKTLKYPDTIRKNPGMYLGGSNNRGNHQACYELISNGVDEYLANFCTQLYLKYDKDENSVIICDNGRGMPVGKHKETGESAIYLILASLHAGGKMEGSTAYVSSGGLHGIGASAANAVASTLKVHTFKNDKWWEVEYAKGILKKKLKKINSGKRMVKKFKTGTQIKYIPDQTLFKSNNAHKISYDWLYEIAEDLSYLCSGLVIHLDNGKKVERFIQKNGGAQYVLDEFDESEEDIVKLHSKPYHFKSKNLEIGLLWSSGDEEDWSAFTNCIHNPGLGVHVDAIRSVIDKSFKKVFNRTGYTGNTLRQGLIGFANLKLTTRPEYEGQTKDKLTSEEAKEVIVKQLSKDFETWLRNTSACAKIITFAIKRGKAAKEMKDELGKEAKDLAAEVKENNKRKHVYCKKLKDAYGCKPEEREIFLVEGESASGTLMQARDDSYQAILELKGKYSNVYKDKNPFKNEDIKNIFTSLGVAPGTKSAADRAKVKRLMLMSDADVDGQHINSLGIALITKYLPGLMDKGKVYIVKAPLFVLTDSSGKKQYAMTDKERNKILKKNPKLKITRMKGWGEAQPEFIAKFAMNPDSRFLEKLKRSEKGDSIVQKIMGEDVQHRKKLLGIGERDE